MKKVSKLRPKTTKEHGHVNAQGSVVYKLGPAVGNEENSKNEVQPNQRRTTSVPATSDT